MQSYRSAILIITSLSVVSIIVACRVGVITTSKVEAVLPLGGRIIIGASTIVVVVVITCRRIYLLRLTVVGKIWVLERRVICQWVLHLILVASGCIGIVVFTIWAVIVVILACWLLVCIDRSLLLAR